MEVSSVHQLCHFLISCSMGRCRISGSLSRMSVLIKSSPVSVPTLLGISDGVIYITTTNITDNEIYRYHLNLREAVSGRNMTKLPSSSKNGAKFSGTEVSFSMFGSFDDLLANVTKFLDKILILKTPNVAIDLVAEDGGKDKSICESLVPLNDLMEASPAISNIERLKLGLEFYVLKHGKNSSDICRTCFPSCEHLKVGTGVAHKTASSRSTAQIMEVVIIISELPQPATPSCFRACEEKTEVLYFKDFSPCPTSKSSLNGMTSIDWKPYGLTLRSVADHDSQVLLEWENLPPHAHIDIAIHHYHKQVVMPSTAQNTHADRNLIKKAVKLALNDLKEKYSGALLSAHAVKICSYAPDLAKTIACLILSSNDSNFQAECLSLLQLQPKGIDGKIVEDCIKKKITAAIELNDRKPQRNREPAPFLFEDDHFEEPDALDEEYEGEDIYSSFDI